MYASIFDAKGQTYFTRAVPELEFSKPVEHLGIIWNYEREMRRGIHKKPMSSEFNCFLHQGAEPFGLRADGHTNPTCPLLTSLLFLLVHMGHIHVCHMEIPSVIDLQVRYIMYPYMKKTLHIMDELESKLKQPLDEAFCGLLL